MALQKGFPPSNLISPSVRIAEKDLSFLGTDENITFRTGLVGFASKGPVNIPTLVTSIRELNTIFGYPHPESGDPYLIYAATGFLSTANQVYIVRVGDINPVSDEAMTTATVQVLTAGGPISIIGNVPVGGGGWSFTEDTFFRFKVNGVLASKILVVLADANRPAPFTGIAYGADELVDALNDQLVPAIDGIEFDFDNKDVAGNPTVLSNLTIESTFAYGPTATIELVSVSDSLYGPASVVGLGTTMTQAVTTGTETQYPTTSIPNPGVYDFSAFAVGLLNLQIVVSGTNNILIDNVVQTVTLPSAVNTITNIVSTINTAISNGTIPGGFVASASANRLRLTTLHSGRDAKLLVKSASTADQFFGFDNLTAAGTSPSGTSGAGSYAYGIVSGTTNTTNEVCFTINADSPGVDGNDTVCVVTNSIEDGTFTIDVYNGGSQVENWGALNKNPASGFYVESFIAANSFWISVVDNTANNALPMESTATNPYVLTGGSDGIPSDPDLQDELLIGSTTAMTGLQALSDSEQINIDLVAIPGHDSTAVVLAMLDLCQNKRGDCFAIIEAPFGLNVREVIQWQNGVHPYNDIQFDSNFGALYWPWVMTRDTFNRVDVWTPPSGSVLAAYARNDSIGGPWTAPAGTDRGIVPGILDVFTRPTLDERDLMYGNRNAVNPIIQFVGSEDFYIWGQKTLQRRPTALDRVNVRRMLLYVEKQVISVSRTLLFEPHDQTLRDSFINLAQQILQEVQQRRGLTDYRIQCDEELNPPEVIDRNELRARIGIIPTRAAEFIFIEFSIHRTGSFGESSESF